MPELASVISCQLIEAKWNFSICVFVFLLGFNLVLVIGQMSLVPYVMKSFRVIKKMQNQMEKLRSMPEWKLQRSVSALTNRSEIMYLVVQKISLGEKDYVSVEWLESINWLTNWNIPNSTFLYLTITYIIHTYNITLHCSMLQHIGYR